MEGFLLMGYSSAESSPKIPELIRTDGLGKPQWSLPITTTSYSYPIGFKQGPGSTIWLGRSDKIIEVDFSTTTLFLGKTQKTEMKISAFPNPFNGRVQFNFPFANSNLKSLEILDLTGRRIKTIRSNSGSWFWKGENNRGLRVGPGVYWAIAKSNSGLSKTRITLVK